MLADMLYWRQGSEGLLSLSHNHSINAAVQECGTWGAMIMGLSKGMKIKECHRNKYDAF